MLFYKLLLRWGGHNKNQSKGMMIVNERMKILRQQYQQPFEVVVADMIDAGKNSTGTQVLLKIYAG